jgi:hypothetical protein
VQPAPQPAAHSTARQPGVPICPGCGIIAPGQATGCEVCKKPFAHPRVVSPGAADGSYWVAVRCSFQCRSCSFLSPLDSLDLDGSVECGQCGMQQRFDVGAWTEALAFAHGVGDLAHPPPEGRHPHPWIWIGGDNPHLRIGYTEAFGEHRQSSTTVENGVHVHRSLFLQASPGHPVCRRCDRPLAMTIEPAGRAVTRCDGCGETATYALPPESTRYAEALCALVCQEHRVDRKQARLETVAGGPIALRCPECGGALPATRDRVVQCAYCKTASLIPARARLRDAGTTLQPEIWWLAFRGPSAERHRVEHPPAWTKEGEAKAEEGSQPGEDQAKQKSANLIARLRGEKDSPLELAPQRPGVHASQLLLSWLLPLLALAIGFAITLLAGLNVGLLR